MQVLEHRQPQHRETEGAGAQRQKTETGHRRRRLAEQLGRGEPGPADAARQQKLQRPDADHEHQSPDCVDRRPGDGLAARQGPAHAPDRQHAERQVDRENPAPGGEIGDDAADHRAEDRPQHDRRAPDRQHPAVPFLRVQVQEDCLAERVDHAPRGALQHAAGDDRRWVGGEGAQQREQHKQRDPAREQQAGAVSAAQPPGQRRHDRCRAQIAGHDPGAEREAAA